MVFVIGDTVRTRDEFRADGVVKSIDHTDQKVYIRVRLEDGDLLYFYPSELEKVS